MIVVGLWGLVALGFSLGLTLLCERVAPRVGLLTHPRGDRWHGASVPLLGGLAIAVGTLVPLTLATWGTSDREFGCGGPPGLPGGIMLAKVCCPPVPGDVYRVLSSGLLCRDDCESGRGMRIR